MEKMKFDKQNLKRKLENEDLQNNLDNFRIKYQKLSNKYKQLKQKHDHVLIVIEELKAEVKENLEKQKSVMKPEIGN